MYQHSKRWSIWNLTEPLQGLDCTITLRSAQTFTGIFAGMQKHNDDQRLAFKMVRDVDAQLRDDVKGGYRGEGPDHTMVFLLSNILTLEIPEAPVSTKAATANGTMAR